MGKKSPFKYEINEIVNNSLIIKKQSNNERYEKIYEVQSIKHPDAPTYTITEYSLKNGTMCSYSSNHRIYEGNSLWSIMEVRPYLVNVEESKTIAPKSNKKIKMKCPCCKRERNLSGKRFFNEGFSCPTCDKNIPYPELFFMAYSEVKKLDFEYQKTFNNLPYRRFDFYNKNIGVVETHGIFHYEELGGALFDAHNKTKNSDNLKKEYCKINNIPYIELDCRKSNFKFIENSINNCEILPNINTSDKDKILNIIESNKRYPIKNILTDYQDGLTSVTIAEKYNISSSTVRRILRKCNIEIRESTYTKKKIRCITTGEVFDSISDACRWCGLKSGGSIGSFFRGEQETAGKHPVTGTPLKWTKLN